MTHLISCLSDDLLTKVGDYAHEARLKVWRQEHTATLSPLLAEFAKVVADAPDYDRSVFDYEIQGHPLLADMDEDERLDFCLDNEGGEWVDGRTIVEPCRPNYAVGLLREIEDMKIDMKQDYSSDMYGGDIAAAVMMIDSESLARLSQHIPELQHLIESQ